MAAAFAVSVAARSHVLGPVTVVGPTKQKGSETSQHRSGSDSSPDRGSLRAVAMSNRLKLGVLLSIGLLSGACGADGGRGPTTTNENRGAATPSGNSADPFGPGTSADGLATDPTRTPTAGNMAQTSETGRFAGIDMSDDATSSTSMESGNSSTSDSGTRGTRSETSCVDPSSILDTSVFDIDVSADIYTVDADTLPEIRQQMTARSPSTMAAATQWYVFWDFDWEACDKSGLTLGLEVSYSMPRWDRPTGASTEVVEGWTNFVDALWCHEYGHTRFAVDLLRDTYAALSALPAPTSCAALRRSAQAAFQPLYERYIEEEEEYDRVTNHGETMGARLCPDEERTGCD